MPGRRDHNGLPSGQRAVDRDGRRWKQWDDKLWRLVPGGRGVTYSELERLFGPLRLL